MKKEVEHTDPLEPYLRLLRKALRKAGASSKKDLRQVRVQGVTLHHMLLHIPKVLAPHIIKHFSYEKHGLSSITYNFEKGEYNLSLDVSYMGTKRFCKTMYKLVLFLRKKGEI